MAKHSQRVTAARPSAPEPAAAPYVPPPATGVQFGNAGKTTITTPTGCRAEYVAFSLTPYPPGVFNARVYVNDPRRFHLYYPGGGRGFVGDFDSAEAMLDEAKRLWALDGKL